MTADTVAGAAAFVSVLSFAGCLAMVVLYAGLIQFNRRLDRALASLDRLCVALDYLAYKDDVEEAELLRRASMPRPSRPRREAPSP